MRFLFLDEESANPSLLGDETLDASRPTLNGSSLDAPAMNLSKESGFEWLPFKLFLGDVGGFLDCPELLLFAR
jgi:hypothetical protein